MKQIEQGTYIPHEDPRMQRDPDIPFQLMFRAVKQDDLNFILSSWLKSYRDAKRTVKNEAYFHGQQRLIAALADRRQMVVGVDVADPDWIVGFACGRKMDDDSLLLDYVYVKQPYRMRNIGRALIAALGWSDGMPIVATHWNRTASHLAGRFIATHNDYYLSIGAPT